MLSRSDGDISNKSQETRSRIWDYKKTMKKVGDNQDDHLVGVQDKAGMRRDLIVGRRWSDGPGTMEERARKQRSGENALCDKLLSYMGWEGDQGEAAAGTERDVSEDRCTASKHCFIPDQRFLKTSSGNPSKL